MYTSHLVWMDKMSLLKRWDWSDNWKMSSSFLGVLLSTPGNLKMKTLSSRHFNLIGQYFLETFTEHKFLWFIKKVLWSNAFWKHWLRQLNCFPYCRILLEIFICQGALRISKEIPFPIKTGLYTSSNASRSALSENSYQSVEDKRPAQGHSAHWW